MPPQRPQTKPPDRAFGAISKIEVKSYGIRGRKAPKMEGKMRTGQFLTNVNLHSLNLLVSTGTASPSPNRGKKKTKSYTDKKILPSVQAKVWKPLGTRRNFDLTMLL